MNILRDKFIRDTGALVLKTKNLVFKFPLSVAAYWEITNEIKILHLVAKDRHFKQYLPKPRLFVYFLITSLMNDISKHPEAESLIKDYFNKTFAETEQNQWPEVALIKLPNCQYFMSFIKENFPQDHTMWKNLLSQLTIAQSSSHGDFYLDNILVDKENKLFFIDWPQYDNFSSRFFDLINFHILSSVKRRRFWIQAWQECYNSGINSFQGIEVNKKYLVAYAIFKISKELNILQIRRQLNGYKKEKYVNLIIKLAETINFDYNKNFT